MQRWFLLLWHEMEGLTSETSIRSAWTRPVMPGFRKMHDTGCHSVFPLPTLVSSQPSVHTESCSPSGGDWLRTPTIQVSNKNAAAILLVKTDAAQFPITVGPAGWGQPTPALTDTRTQNTRVWPSTDRWVCMIHGLPQACRFVWFIFLTVHPMRYKFQETYSLWIIMEEPGQNSSGSLTV